MNYDIKAELLAEGWKHEQLIEEDWEDLKKELTDLYVAGKITERQISTRLSKAGMGGLSRNAAYKITHDPENVQKREIALQKVKDREEKLKRIEAKTKNPNYGKTRGSLAQAYCNAWNEKFGHIVKAGVMKENYDTLESLLEETIEYLMEEGNELSTKTQAKKMKLIDGLKKAKKIAKKTAIGLAAAGTLAATPGVVGAVKNVKAQSENRKAQEYNDAEFHKQQDEERNKMAKKLRDAGIEVGEDAKETAGKAKKKAKELYGKAKEKTSKYFEY